MPAERRNKPQADPPSLPTRPEALAFLRRALSREAIIEVETLAVEKSAGRVCATTIRSACASPTAAVSTRDGVAVRSGLTRNASPDHPVRCALGQDCRPVNTGWKLPPGTDAVAPREEVVLTDQGRAEFRGPVKPGQYVRPRGEDLEPGDVVVGPEALIDAADVGALLTAGVYELPVFEPVRLVFISTGDEVLPFRSRPVPGPGQVIESNARVFCSLAEGWGAVAESAPPVPDDPEALALAVRTALDHGAHVVAVGAGSSYSDKDHSHEVFAAAGEVLVRGLAMVPGRPGILATAQGRLLAGVPGNPAGALAFMEEIVGPLVCWLGRRPTPRRTEVRAVMACGLAPRPGMERLVRLGLGRVDDTLVAAPLDRRSGLVRTLSRATGLLRIPADRPPVRAGEDIRAELLAPHLDPDDTLVVLGVRHRALDILADELEAARGPRLAFARTPQAEALAALADGRALAASCVPSKDNAPLKDLAARILPLGTETALAVPESRLNDPRIRALLDLLADPAILRRLA